MRRPARPFLIQLVREGRHRSNRLAHVPPHLFHFHHAFFGDHNVCRLNVPVHDIVPVRVGERLTDTYDILEFHGERKDLALFDELVEASSLDELHGNKGSVTFVAKLIDGHDVGMLESAGGARFLIKALQRIPLRGPVSEDSSRISARESPQLQTQSAH